MKLGLRDTIDIIEKLVNGEALSIDPAELGEIVLANERHAAHAQTLLIFSQHPDKKAAWERFVSSSVRIYGWSWRQRLDEGELRSPISYDPLNQNRIGICSTACCMELAWVGDCDQCFVRRLGR